MGSDPKSEKRALGTRFVAAAEVGEAFKKAPNIDRQRFRVDLDDVVNQDSAPRCRGAAAAKRAGQPEA